MADSADAIQSRRARVIGPADHRELVWMGLFLMASALLAITNKTFWMDECISAEFAKQPTLKECWTAMLAFPEVQLPFYMLYLWSMVHSLGTNEWVLRMAGFPWFVAGAMVFVVSVGRLVGSRWVVALLIGFNAFAWFYLNEARVYSIQLGLALAFVGAGVALAQATLKGERLHRWLRVFLISLVLLSGTSALGAFWGLFLTLGLIALLPRASWVPLLRSSPKTLGVSALLLFGLAAYYAWTLKLQAKPTPGVTDVRTALFALYEIFGAAGLGPGRNDLRGEGVAALRPFLLPILIFAAVAGAVFWRGLYALWQRCGAGRTLSFLAVLAGPFLLLCLIGVMRDMRVLGRHATPMVALVLVTTSFGVVGLMSSGRQVQRITAGLFLILSLGSCLFLRFAPRHEKDDYRGAAALAKAALDSGQTVWWSANDLGGEFYNLPMQRNFSEPGAVKLILNRSEQDLRTLARPDLIIVSKPDIFDIGRGLEAYARAEGFQIAAKLPAFVVLKRP